MPMECPRCAFRDETATICPSCGSPMRFTLLNPQGDSDAAKSQAGNQGNDSFVTRFFQFLGALLSTMVAGSVLAPMATFGLIVIGYNPRALPEEQPEMFHGLLTTIPFLSIVLGHGFALRGVYLAQLVAIPAGLASSAVFIAARIYFNWHPSTYEMILIPVSATILAFMVGLVVGGSLQRQEEVRLNLEGTWNRTAKPRLHVITESPETRLNRLLIGLVVAVGVQIGLPMILWFLLSPLYTNKAVLTVLMARVTVPIVLFAAFCGGVASGSATTTGIRQGALCGVLFTLVALQFQWVAHVAILGSVFLLTMLGGYLGQKIFGPSRVYRQQSETDAAFDNGSGQK